MCLKVYFQALICGDIMICNLCPRKCNALRQDASGTGVCQKGTLPSVAKASVHMWEEPCISGENGSGTVFFSGCSLKCVFCQNEKISNGGFGKTVSVARLKEIYSELIQKGVHNINLVNPTHFTESILKSLDRPLPVPVVYNCGGYEDVSSLKMLEGKIQIYLPDMKYFLSAPAAKYSLAPDYPDVAKKAIMEMYRQVGPYELDENGIMKKGVIIRHLILPGNIENSLRVIDWVSETFSPGQVLFSLMSQFTPTENCAKFPEINRALTQKEHETVTEYLCNSDIEDGFMQDLESSSDTYIPDFDLSGVDKF